MKCCRRGCTDLLAVLYCFIFALQSVVQLGVGQLESIKTGHRSGLSHSIPQQRQPFVEFWFVISFTDRSASVATSNSDILRAEAKFIELIDSLIVGRRPRFMNLLRNIEKSTSWIQDEPTSSRSSLPALWLPSHRNEDHRSCLPAPSNSTS